MSNASCGGIGTPLARHSYPAVMKSLRLADPRPPTSSGTTTTSTNCQPTGFDSACSAAPTWSASPCWDSACRTPSARSSPTSSRRPSRWSWTGSLLDDVKALGETWFLARVFALLRSAGIEAVTTFSDPWPRLDRHGRSVHVGHIGTVFQAASAIYTGLTARETFHQLHDTGELVHRRAVSKFRNGERSSHYLETVLLGVGAPPRWPNETPDAWLDRVLPLVSSPYVHGATTAMRF